MEPSELDKLVASFQSKLKPVTKEQMAEAGLTFPPPTPEEVEAAGPPPFEEKPAEELVPAGAGCVTKQFKTLVSSLSPNYIGKPVTVKELVVGVLDALEVCEG